MAASEAAALALHDYREGQVSGAGTAVSYLEFFRDVSFATLVVLGTGGLASGAIPVSGSLAILGESVLYAGATTGGAAALTRELCRELGEEFAGDEPGVDVARVIISTIEGMVGGALSGVAGAAFGKGMTEGLGSLLARHGISEASSSVVSRYMSQFLLGIGQGVAITGPLAAFRTLIESGDFEEAGRQYLRHLATVGHGRTVMRTLLAGWI